MNREEFAQQIEGWKQELISDVIRHYQAGDRERGRLAYQRWKGRFAAFLKGYVPDEVRRFHALTYHMAYVVKRGEHPLDEFMREDGDKCLAFIDDLDEAVSKGLVTLSEESTAVTNPPTEPKEEVSIGSPTEDKQANIEATDTMKDPRIVFVIHGRNLEARDSLFRFLRSIGLRPLEWSQAIKETSKASPFIGEILDIAFSQAQAVIVLMTPDDLAQLHELFRNPHDPPYESQLTGQARPNVLFEAGMAMGRDPDRTVIVEIGTLRPFSDIAGRHTVRISNTSGARHELAQRLQTAGCAVDLTGRDWHTEGDFSIELDRAEATTVATQQRGQSAQATAQTPKDESEKAEYFKHCTSRQKEILRSYIEHKTRTQQLRYDEGAVVELIQAEVLYYASNRAATIWNPGEYYTDINMNLWAWKYLNEHPELIAPDPESS